MKPNNAQRRMLRLMHGIGSWLVLAAFVGIGHAPAFAGQVDMVAGDEAMQPSPCWIARHAQLVTWGPHPQQVRLEAATARTALPPPPG